MKCAIVQICKGLKFREMTLNNECTKINEIVTLNFGKSDFRKSRKIKKSTF